MGGVDKTTRILLMYSKLSEGGRINKKSFCLDMEIDRRTFDRDIEDIRLFLSESFQGDELLYDRMDETYHLKNCFHSKALSGMEIVFLLELLKSSQSLRKDEYRGLISGIIGAGEGSQRILMSKIAKRYIQTYPEQEKQAALLKMQWDLQQCIAECDVIQLKLKKKEKVTIYPVSLWIYEYEIYLFAYDKNEELQIFAVTNIDYFEMSKNKFNSQLIYKFDRMDWKVLKEKLEKEREQHEEN